MTKQTFTELVLSSEKTLCSISMSMLKNENDSKDAVQAAILSAYEKLSTLKKDEYFKTWLVRILINVCNKQLNSRKRVTEMQQNYNFQSTIESSAENIEVRLAVESLPMKIRQIIVLYYIEQFTTKEISSILRIPKGTVMSRLAKGRELLRIELE